MTFPRLRPRAWWPTLWLVGALAHAQEGAAPAEKPAAAAAPEPAPAPSVPSVLFMPLEPLAGVTRDLAVQITAVLVTESGNLEGYDMRSFRELEGALTQEQLKQASGCDSAGCAAELAGALNADQIVIGSLGKLGASYLLTLSRITESGKNVGRAVVKVKDEEALVADMPATVRTLFGVATPAASATTPPVEKAPEKTSEKAAEKPTEKAATAPLAPGPGEAVEETPPDKPGRGAEKGGGRSVGRQLGDAFGALVSTGKSLMGNSRGGRTLKSINNTQSFAWMPEGRVTLGCPPKEKCGRDDAKAHPAETRGFWINKTEVTVKSYLACVAAGACTPVGAARDKVQACNLGQKRLAHPANCVNYSEAQKYCEWEGGRLPTSDEWEYAARGGRAVMFPWGNDPLGSLKANTCDKQCPGYKMPRKADKALDDGFALTAPVGNYPSGASPGGLQDMAGNVREWSMTTDRLKRHELLGGSFASPAAQVVTWARGKSLAAKWDPQTGFRCVRLTPRPGENE